MHKGRLEAFSDGVIAIIITIMVLELKVPHGTEFSALQPLVPVFFCYVLSFVFVAIYWNNHHHLLQATRHVSGPALWANMHLLFWLSLIPFVTSWMGENGLAPLTVALYGTVLLMSGMAYFILVRTLISCQGNDSVLAAAIGSDRKGLLSVALYLAAIPLAFQNAMAACAIYILVAAIWLIPDRRIERALAPSKEHGQS